MEAIIMPQIGQDLTHGVVLEWLKKEGDPVEKGEVVVSVESEKAAFDVEAEASGILLKIEVAAGEEGEVFKPVGYIGAEGESIDDGETHAKAEKEPAAAPVEKTTAPATAKTAAPLEDGRILSSPSARRIAAEMGIDIADVTGSGPNGRIVKKDVLEQTFKARPTGGNAKALAVKIQGDLEDRKVPFDKIGKIAAQRLSLSKQTIPHFYLDKEIDMEDVMEWRAGYNRKHNTKITVTDMIVYAAALTLNENPRYNSHVDDQAVYYKKNINVGVATATPNGLVVPVVANANEMTIDEVSVKIKKNSADAQKGRIDMSAKGTFSVTSLGMFGIPKFNPIINPPECAILSVGAVELKVVPVNGNYIGIRKMVTVSLASDHRAVSGVDAAKFLQKLNDTMIELFGIA